MSRILAVRFAFSSSPSDGGLARGAVFMDGHRIPIDRWVQVLPSERPVLAAFLRDTNGSFVLADRTDDRVVAAVDKVRSRPLFFTEHKGILHIGDDPYALAALWDGSGPLAILPEVAAEFLMAGFVTGRDTLHKQVYQLGPGEFLFAERDGDAYSYAVQPYFRYLSTVNIEGDATSVEWARQLDHVVTAAVERLIEVADGRALVIPLSGGRDSRLIAMKLKQSAYPHVYCYSYGSPDDVETQISRAVAARLRYPWAFVRYSADRWRGYRGDPSFLAYAKRAHALSQIEHIQDWPAVHALREELPSDSVFVPGHTLDVVAGSHLPLAWEYERSSELHLDALEKAILDMHFSLWPANRLQHALGFSSSASLRTAVALRLKVYLDSLDMTIDLAGMVQAFEYFDWFERQAKFIVNSVRVYEDQGFEWWLPWWDSELLDFWASVPLPLRFGKRLLNGYVDSLQTTLGLDPLPMRRRRIVETSWVLIRDAARFRTVAPIWHGLVRDDGWVPLEGHPMRWYGLVEPEIEAWGYSGSEHINAYLSRSHLEHRIASGQGLVQHGR